MIRKFVREVIRFTIIILACSVLLPLTDGEAAERHFGFAIRNHETAESFAAIASDSTHIWLSEEQPDLPDVNVSGDCRTGLTEAAYILHKLSGLI